MTLKKSGNIQKNSEGPYLPKGFLWILITCLQLISNAAALSQTGHRSDEMVVPRSIAREGTGVELMDSK